jgi:hypothetical protein
MCAPTKPFEFVRRTKAFSPVGDETMVVESLKSMTVRLWNVQIWWRCDLVAAGISHSIYFLISFDRTSEAFVIVSWFAQC